MADAKQSDFPFKPAPEALDSIPLINVNTGLQAKTNLSALPISNPTQSALDLKVNTGTVYTKSETAALYEPVNANIQAHIISTINPHAVTKAQINLGNVDNTSDINKPVSTLQAVADTDVSNFAVQRANHTGTQAATTIDEDSTHRFITDTDKTKLDNTSGVNTGDQDLSGYELLANKDTGTLSASTSTYPTSSAVKNAVDSKASKNQSDFISGILETVSDGDFQLVTEIPYGATITKVSTRSASGTCTATFKINSTALGGTPNAVTTSQQDQAHTSANVLVAGDDIVLTISSNSSCKKMSFTIKFNRILE